MANMTSSRFLKKRIHYQGNSPYLMIGWNLRIPKFGWDFKVENRNRVGYVNNGRILNEPQFYKIRCFQNPKNYAMKILYIIYILPYVKIQKSKIDFRQYVWITWRQPWENVF